MAKRRRLIWQLYPSYLAIVLLAMLATGWYASTSMRQFYLAQTRQELLAQAQLLSRQFLPLLQQLDYDAVDRICKQIPKTVPTRLTVVSPNGVVWGDSEAEPRSMENHGDRPEIRQALAGGVGTVLRYSGTLRCRMMYVALPLDSTSNQGVVRVSRAITAIENQIHRWIIHLTLGGIVIALLTSVVCWLISKRISRPIEELRQGADRFARGELSHHLHLPPTTELAALAHAMNQMATELEQRIQTVIQQGQETEAVLSSMVEAVVALDTEERITHLNGAAALLLNAESNPLQGRSIQEIIRNRQVHQMIESTLSEGTTTEGDIALYQNQEQIFNTRCTPLLGAQGQRIGALLVLNDVTRLRRLEIMRSDFAANVSHEIKTPLTAIKGFVQTLIQGAVEDPREVQRFLGIIHKHVNRLTAMVDDLMRLSRLEQGEKFFSLRLENIAVNSVLNAAIRLCRSKAEAKQINFVVECLETLVAPMDAELMEQAVVNLLDNAVTYSPAGSRIVVAAGATDQEVLIRIEDQGIGIAEKHLPRLFERFYRVDKARSRQMGGTGLGLAIVKHIVQAHGGHVSVKSTQGKGSIFTIHLSPK